MSVHYNVGRRYLHRSASKRSLDAIFHPATVCVCVSNCESDWVKFLIYIALLTVDIIKQLPNIDLNLMQQIIHLICWIKMNCSFQLVISVQIQVFIL